MVRYMLRLAVAAITAQTLAATAAPTSPASARIAALEHCAVAFKPIRILSADEYSARVESTAGRIFRLDFSKRCFDSRNQFAAQFNYRRMVPDFCIGPGNVLRFVSRGVPYSCRIGQVTPLMPDGE